MDVSMAASSHFDEYLWFWSTFSEIKTPTNFSFSSLIFSKIAVKRWNLSVMIDQQNSFSFSDQFSKFGNWPKQCNSEVISDQVFLEKNLERECWQLCFWKINFFQVSGIKKIKHGLMFWNHVYFFKNPGQNCIWY